MHAAVILAAGGSRRLGQSKQWLRIDGKPLLRHVVDLVATTAASPIIVVLGAHADALRDVVGEVDGLRCIVNEEWEEGLASSLRAAANELADWTGATLIVGCDQPRLTAGHLEALLQQGSRQLARDIASRYGDAIGTPALVRAGTLAEARGLRGDQGLRRLLRDTAITVEAAELGFDIDTPDDLAAARDAGWIDQAG